MDITSINGLPAHPLLVHIPVVLIPLALVGSVLVAVRPSWRRSLAVIVAVLAVVGAAGVFLAVNTGESLEEQVEGTMAPGGEELIEDHASAGERAEPFVVVFAALAVGAAALDLVDRRRGGDAEGSPRNPAVARALPIVVVASVLAGGVASWVVYDAGHSGAKATWSDVQSERPEQGEG